MEQEHATHIAALERELAHAKHNKPGGQPSDPDRVAAIKDQLRSYRKKAGVPNAATVDAEPLETADRTDDALETTDGPKARTRESR